MIHMKLDLLLVKQVLVFSPPHVIRLISSRDNEDNGKQSLRRLMLRIHSSVRLMQEDA